MKANLTSHPNISEEVTAQLLEDLKRQLQTRVQVDAANRPYDRLEIGFYRQPCSVIGTGDKKLAQTTSRPALIPYCGLIQSTSSQRTMSTRLPDFESRTISHKQR